MTLGRISGLAMGGLGPGNTFEVKQCVFSSDL